MRAREVVFTASVALATASASAADEGLGLGTRVRVAGLGVPEGGAASEPVGGRVVGRVVAIDDSSLTVVRADGSRVAFFRKDLRLLETSPGPRSPIRGALRGGVIAGAFGAGIGLLWFPPWTANGAEEDRAAGAKYFGLRAAVLGMAVGAIAPGERWSRVEVGRAQVRFAPTTGPRGRGAGLAVSVGF